MQKEASHFIPWPIIDSAILLAFAMFIPEFSIPPMEHIIRAELGFTYAQTSLFYTAPILMTAIVAIPAGFATDRIGIRKSAGIGAILLASGSILRSTTSDPSSLLAFTFLYGFGLGWALPSLPKLVSGWAHREKATVATGIYSVGLYVGPALALAITMPVVFPITNTIQGTFLIWSIPTVVAAAAWWILVRDPPPNNDASDHISSSKAIFYSIMKNKGLWLLAVFNFLYFFFYFNWTGWAPALLMQKGATADLAGLITSITIWVGIPAVFLIPRLFQRIGLRKPFLWLPAIILALASLGALYTDLSLSWPLMALVGIADCAMLITMLTLPMELTSHQEVGAASGLVLSIGHIGGVIGPLVGGRILDITGKLDLSLIVLIGVTAAAAIIASRLPETGPRASHKQGERP
jgi:CP family cyanate transporter-like MFS transporter